MPIEEITITISMDYVVWMLDHPDEVSEAEKEWVDEFKRLFFEHMKEQYDKNN